MMHFVRKLSSKPTLSRVAALAAAGSGMYSFTTSSDHNASILVSMPSSFRDSLEWPWITLEGIGHFPSLMRSNHSQYALLQLSFSQPDMPDPDISKGISSDSGHSPKHNCNCLGRDTIANAAAKIGPAVVNLSVIKADGKSTGSGTIIDGDGTILTCTHVLRSSSTGKVEVTLQDGRQFEGTVVNADAHDDIAIVKIKSKTPLPTAKLGSSAKLRPGDWVVAMGCPLTLQNTVTVGIVSCVDRKAIDLGLGGMHREYLQTDCAMNQGNSGGPLVNVDGEVIGVNIISALTAHGLSFAVPVDSVTKILAHFNRNGRVVRPWLGLKMIDLNDMIVAHLKETNASFPDVRRGILIPMVSPGSPADRAGFRPGDVLVEFGGKPIESIKEVVDIMNDKVGKPFKAVVKRGKNVTQTLTVIPEEANPQM